MRRKGEDVEREEEGTKGVRGGKGREGEAVGRIEREGEKYVRYMNVWVRSTDVSRSTRFLAAPSPLGWPLLAISPYWEPAV